MNTLASQCAEVLRRAGAAGGVESGGVHLAENAWARIANHILGGARFGSDRKDSVLDRDCKAWDFENLYVTDGSFMPTSGGGNPTLTIQANAFRVAEVLKGRV
jgi:choline dehydrogenase-like flavoprotein